MKQTRVLAIDDEPTILDLCRSTLEARGYAVHVFQNGREGIAAAQRERFDLVLIDLWMHDVEGLEILREIQAIDRSTVAVMITGEPTIESAVEAVKQGAFDYLPKPFTPDQLLIVAERGLAQKRLVEENLLLRRSLKSRPGFEGIVGRSREMERVLDLVAKVADSDSSVVIEGETGTGKELVARCLHRNSSRHAGPFLPINCGALPEELLESELFGHERGAFTGAHTRKPGLLEVAHGGTVFLDEIAALSLNLQVKLLRVLQERRVRRVGGQEENDIDIRVLSATNENLEQMVEGGGFRSDLYYRLNVITILLPPLRERLDDIPLLAEHFLQELNRDGKKRVEAVSGEALEILQRYSWPGNVREMQNVVERAFWLTESRSIGPEDLPARLTKQAEAPLKIDASLPFSEAKRAFLKPFERGYLIQLLSACDGNVTRAAAQSGLHRSSLQRLLKKYGIRSRAYRRES